STSLGRVEHGKWQRKPGQSCSVSCLWISAFALALILASQSWRPILTALWPLPIRKSPRALLPKCRPLKRRQREQHKACRRLLWSDRAQIRNGGLAGEVCKGMRNVNSCRLLFYQLDAIATSCTKNRTCLKKPARSASAPSPGARNGQKTGTRFATAANGAGADSIGSPSTTSLYGFGPGSPAS